MEKCFLAKIKNSNDRDHVFYIEFGGFECEHYFSLFHILGACFCGFEKELYDVVLNDFDNLETILTKEEFIRLYHAKEEISKLGYGIVRDSEKYNAGIKIFDSIKDIQEKLKGKENNDLFNRVIEEKKAICMEAYDLTKEEVDYIFQCYKKVYQDSSIIGAVYEDKRDLAENEKFSFGYDKIPYFDDEAFVNDLLKTYEYLELDSGKIVYLCY